MPELRPCPYCGYVFDLAYDLARHLCGHHDWGRCPCGFEGTAIRYFVDELADHIRNTHDLVAHLAEANVLAAARERRGDA